MERPHLTHGKQLNRSARRTDGAHIGSDIRMLIEAMVDNGFKWHDAAKHVNLPIHVARYALNKPHVLAHLKKRRIERLAVSCARNPARLDALADQTENLTAAVKAIQVLEAMQTEASQPTIRQTSPGVIIQINAPEKQVTVAPAPAVIEHQDSNEAD